MKIERIFREKQGEKILLVGILFLFYLPVLSVLAKAFLTGDALVRLREILRAAAFLQTLRFSLKEALISAIFSLLLALPGAYFFGRYDFPGKRSLRSALTLPFMLPGILVVLGMVVFYGQNGFFNRLLTQALSESGWKFTGLYGFWGIILAHVFYNFPFCLRMLGESWERIDPKLREASMTLGGSPFYTWRRVTLPLLAPSMAYLFMLVFLYSFLSFTIPLVLGGFLYKTFEVLIYIEYNVKLRFDQAALLAAVQLLILAGVLYLQTFFGGRLRRQDTIAPELPRLNRRRHPLAVAVFLMYLVFIFFFFFGPMVVLLFQSFKARGLLEGKLTGQNYGLLFSEGFRFAVGQDLLTVFGASLALAISVSLLTACLAYLIARARRRYPWGRIDLWLQLPLGVSFLTFAFGLITLARGALPSWLLIIWAQLFLAFPLVYSILRTAWRELGESALEAAITLGASPGVVLRTVELPLMKKAIGAGLSYAAALSLGDLAAVLTLGQGKVITLSVAVYRLLGHYRFPQAIALGALFILLSFLLFLGVGGGYPLAERPGRE